VARRLGVSQATVLRAVARGILTPAENTPGGHHRFRAAEADALARALSHQPDGSMRLISTSAAARLLGVSQHTVMRACREGRLQPDETTPGGHHRFSEERIRKLAPSAGELVGSGRAARALGVTVDKLRRAVQRGAVTPATVTPGGHRRFAAADLSAVVFGPNGNSNGHPDGGGARNGHA
jgi:DNA-binding transcriptional MerR regulator